MRASALEASLSRPIPSHLSTLLLAEQHLLAVGPTVAALSHGLEKEVAVGVVPPNACYQVVLSRVSCAASKSTPVPSSRSSVLKYSRLNYRESRFDGRSQPDWLQLYVFLHSLSNSGSHWIIALLWYA